MSMKIEFLGWGKTGREAIVPFLRDPQVEVAWVLRQSDESAGELASRLLFEPRDQGVLVGMSQWSKGAFLDAHPVDLVVDFSGEEGMDRYRAFADRGIRIVSALSHKSPDGQGHLDYAAAKVAVLSSPNITWGINFLIAMAGFLKAVTDEPDIEIIEEHFLRKSGRSGTALQIAKALGLEPEKIHSIRAGGILGRHEVVFGFPNQTVRFTHETIHRAAFGRGALTSAKWLTKQEPGLYAMSNLIEERLTAHLMRQNLATAGAYNDGGETGMV